MEIDPNLIYLGLALAGSGGTIGGWIFKRGKKEGVDESCAQRIEKELKSIKTTLDAEIKNTDESHRQLHGRIDKLSDRVDAHAANLHEKINEVKQNVAFVKGTVENHIQEAKD